MAEDSIQSANDAVAKASEYVKDVEDHSLSCMNKFFILIP